MKSFSIFKIYNHCLRRFPPMRRDLLLLILSVIGVFFPADAEGGAKYYNYFRMDVSNNGAPTFSIEKDNLRGAVYFSDVGLFATFCADDADFLCFESKMMSFALPRKRQKNGLPENEQWEYGGYKYYLRTDIRNIEIFDRKIAVFEFERDKSTNSSRFRFVFSPTNGLIAVLISHPKEDLAVFVSARQCGFGAASACRESAR